MSGNLFFVVINFAAWCFFGYDISLFGAGFSACALMFDVIDWAYNR